MNDKFDELAKTMAQPVPRRAALRRFGVGLGVIAVTLMMFTTVSEGNGSRTFRVNGKLLPVGDEQHASGIVKITLTLGSTSGRYSGSANCKGLIPNASYKLWGMGPVISWDDFWRIGVADSQGMVQFRFSGGYGSAGYPNWFELYRIEPTSDVLVLSGGAH